MVASLTLSEAKGGSGSSCPPGSIQPVTNCQAGTYKFKESGTPFYGCKPCPEGTYQTEYGQTSCKPCPEGTYQDEHGQTGCRKCPGTVELDEETIIDLAKRWREASYPSLNTTENESKKENAPQDSPSEETSGTKTSDPDTTDTNKEPIANDKSDVADEPQTSDFQQSESVSHGDTPDASSAETDQKTGLELDPQLRRAVEYLKQQSSGDSKQPTTA